MSDSSGPTQFESHGRTRGEAEETCSLRPAVFLDRDGTLNVHIVRDGSPYPPSALEDFKLFDGVAEACGRLEEAGFALVVATNQPDVGRGRQRQEVVEAMHLCLRHLIPSLVSIQVCYHGGEAFGQPCKCRKPQPGMLLTAAAQLGLDLGKSWMVGDRWSDIEAGRAAGCRTVFIDYGYIESQPNVNPGYKVTSFTAAVDLILRNNTSKLFI